MFYLNELLSGCKVTLFNSHAITTISEFLLIEPNLSIIQKEILSKLDDYFLSLGILINSIDCLYGDDCNGVHLSIKNTKIDYLESLLQGRAVFKPDLNIKITDTQLIANGRRQPIEALLKHFNRFALHVDILLLSGMSLDQYPWLNQPLPQSND